MPSLLRDEARARFDLLSVTAYDLTLDLRGEETFPSRTVIDLTSRGGDTFLDLKARTLASISLDGQALPVEVEVELAFAHQAERRGRRAREAAAAELVEGAADELAELHHVTGAALAQREHGDQVLALRAFLADAQALVELFLDRAVQACRHRAQLLDGDALELFEQALGLIASGGTVVVVGLAPAGETATVDLPALFRRRARVLV